MKSFINRATIAAALFSFALAGCSTASPTNATGTNSPSPSTAPGTASASASPTVEKKLKVVTTFYPMYEFSKQVAGDYADVTVLVPAGAEPHEWEPSAKDIAQIQEANVFVYTGAGYEGWVDKALESVNKDKVVAVEASKGITLMEGTAEEHANTNEHVMDPHVWLDPVLAQQEVQSIQAALEKADPAHKDAYKKNADAYIAKLQELDKSYKDGLASVKRKEFVTSHAAFGYMAKRYGLTQVPIAGLSPEQEPSAAEMADIVKFAKEHQVKTIFFETLVTPKIAETIAKEIGAKSDVLNPIEGLTDDDIKQNLDFIGLMKNNLNALKKALNE